MIDLSSLSQYNTSRKYGKRRRSCNNQHLIIIIQKTIISILWCCCHKNIIIVWKLIMALVSVSSMSTTTTSLFISQPSSLSFLGHRGCWTSCIIVGRALCRTTVGSAGAGILVRSSHHQYINKGSTSIILLLIDTIASTITPSYSAIITSYHNHDDYDDNENEEKKWKQQQEQLRTHPQQQTSNELWQQHLQQQQQIEEEDQQYCVTASTTTTSSSSTSSSQPSIKIFYNDVYHVALPPNHRFPMEKYGKVRKLVHRWIYSYYNQQQQHLQQQPNNHSYDIPTTTSVTSTTNSCSSNSYSSMMQQSTTAATTTRTTIPCDNTIVAHTTNNRMTATPPPTTTVAAALYEFCISPLATMDELYTTHCPLYIHRFISGNQSKQEQRNVGFPWSWEGVQRALSSVGGTIAAACYVCEQKKKNQQSSQQMLYQHQEPMEAMNQNKANLLLSQESGPLMLNWAAHLAGGTHHAFYNYGEGFCVFSDIAVAANVILQRYSDIIQHVLILDLDVHQGNGNAVLFQNNSRVFTFSMHCIGNYFSKQQQSDMDVELPIHCTDEMYLQSLQYWLQQLSNQQQYPKFDIIFFQAGVDILEQDRLGQMNITLQGIEQRNQMVYEFATKINAPLVITMGGGYPKTKDWIPILVAHATVYYQAYQFLSSKCK